jgi:hypothetical protein
MKRGMTTSIVLLAGMALVAPTARGNFVGDMIYCANARYQATTASMYRYGVAAAHFDYNTGFAGGGVTDPGAYDPVSTTYDVAYGSSEPLAQNDNNYGSRDALWNGRALVMYDANTALQLNAMRWGSGGANVYLTQLEHRDGQAYENDPGVIDIDNGVLDATGGMLSGRLQLAVGPEGGYDETAGYGGARKELSAIETAGMTRADRVWDMGADGQGNLYVCGRAQVGGVDTGLIFKVPKLNGTRALGSWVGQRVGDAGVFGAATQLVAKQVALLAPWYTGVAVDAGGYVYGCDRGTNALDVYDGTGALKMSIDIGAEGLVPEAVRVDPSYGGAGDRVVLNVYDVNAVVKLLVLDVDPVATTWSVAAQLSSGDLRENGLGGSAERVDWIEISPGGDIFYVDSRGNGDGRQAMVSADDYQAAVAAAGGGLATVTVVGVDVFNDRGNDYGRGAAFVPEPGALSLLGLGLLAVLRRRRRVI